MNSYDREPVTLIFLLKTVIFLMRDGFVHFLKMWIFLTTFFIITLSILDIFWHNQFNNIFYIAFGILLIFLYFKILHYMITGQKQKIFLIIPKIDHHEIYAIKFQLTILLYLGILCILSYYVIPIAMITSPYLGYFFIMLLIIIFIISFLTSEMASTFVLIESIDLGVKPLFIAALKTILKQFAKIIFLVLFILVLLSIINIIIPPYHIYDYGMYLAYNMINYFYIICLLIKIYLLSLIKAAFVGSLYINYRREIVENL